MPPFNCSVVPFFDVDAFLCLHFVCIAELFYYHSFSLECICWPIPWLPLILIRFKQTFVDVLCARYSLENR